MGGCISHKFVSARIGDTEQVEYYKTKAFMIFLFYQVFESMNFAMDLIFNGLIYRLNAGYFSPSFTDNAYS